jgi:histidinol-phosphate aminotransferase
MNASVISPMPEIAVWVERIVRDDIRALAAYHVQDANGMVKLDAMENPYALPQGLRQEIGEIAARAELNRYPDSEARELKAVLRAAMGVSEGMALLLGNGSDEIIQLLALACAKPGAVMLGVEPSFAMFPMVARFCGLEFVGVPLGANFRLETDRMLDAIERHRPPLIFIAYPNNPTGNLFDAGAVETIVRRAPGLVVIDEAYHPFAQTSFMPRLHKFPNLLVMRTLSKLGLAGVRLGALAGRPEWITELNKLRLPYNVNVLTQVVAAYVLKHADVLEAQAAQIRAERSRLLSRLRAMSRVEAFPSDANFILFRVPAVQVVFEAIKARGVLIKKLAGSHPALENCLRVTVGTASENDAFLAALTASIE